MNKVNNKNKKDKFKKKNFFVGKLRKTLSIFLLITVLFSILASIVLLPIFVDAMNSLPPLCLNKIKNRMSYNSIVYDRNDQPVNSLAEESFVSVSYDELPHSFIDALIAAEDSKFLVHNGVDGPRTLKSILYNFLRKEITSGGSTITQQLIKLTSLQEKISDSENGQKYKYSNKRKIHEMLLALKLERVMSKEEILTSYVNSISYGRFLGAGTAAKRYFNKKMSELTLPESILLAGIPQSSTLNNPYYYIENATERYNTICELMFRHKYITQEEKDALENIALSDILLVNQSQFVNRNSSFFDSIENELNQLFELKIENDKNVVFPYYYTGLKIYSTMDVEQQEYSNKLMNTDDIVPYNQMLKNIRNGETQKENLQASFIAINNKNGEIPAIGAARNYSGYNMALHGFRSPGSAIKPLIDYAPGVEKFNWTVNTPFKDEKTFYSNSNVQVHNFGNTYSNSFIPLKTALAQSTNTCAVRALQQVGIEYAGEFVNDLGLTKIKDLLDKNELYESAALGGGIETTVYELAGAYSTFANGGIYNKPHFIRRIEDVDGTILYEYKPQNLRLMHQNTSKVITDALQYSRSTGTPATGGRMQVSSKIKFAAKTGTSSYDTNERNKYNIPEHAERDHWIVGYSPDYCIAVWTGFEVENEDFFIKTRGNVNANKKYGSYIMSSWINKFASVGLDFSYKDTQGQEIFVGDIPVRIDKLNNSISWNKPELYIPNKMLANNANDVPKIVYNVYVKEKNGNVIQLIRNEKNVKNLDYSRLKNIQEIKICGLVELESLNEQYQTTKVINL